MCSITFFKYYVIVSGFQVGGCFVIVRRQEGRQRADLYADDSRSGKMMVIKLFGSFFFGMVV